MADITMCSGIKNNQTCPKKDSCYRHTAIPTPQYQSYFMESPFEYIGKVGEFKCDEFWIVSKARNWNNKQIFE